MLEEYVERLDRGLALIDEHITINKTLEVLKALCMINVQTGEKCVEIAEQLASRGLAIVSEMETNNKRLDELKEQIMKEYGIEED